LECGYLKGKPLVEGGKICLSNMEQPTRIKGKALDLAEKVQRKGEEARRKMVGETSLTSSDMVKGTTSFVKKVAERKEERSKRPTFFGLAREMGHL